MYFIINVQKFIINVRTFLKEKVNDHKKECLLTGISYINEFFPIIFPIYIKSFIAAYLISVYLSSHNLTVRFTKFFYKNKLDTLFT
jgi:hypothetical protein